MIWRLTYCNKKGVEARIDIIKGSRTPVQLVEGSGQPFTPSYKLDKNDKSGHIMTSSADIEIFETETFNIDDLKTSNETELKVEYFEDNILTWSGFILPDFFSREIGSPNIVRMTASDRLTALKGVTLSDLPSMVSLRTLIERCLTETGLSLNLASQININQGSTNILDSEVSSQRLTDVRGRSISCYDILMSIMVGTNSTIRQRAGQWQVYNKLEHELRAPTIFFDKVGRGAIRTIQPVASSVGIYQEFGGGRLHPDNYDFAQGVSGWASKNGFSYTISNQKPVSYSVGTPNHTVTFGESDRNRMMIMGVVNPFWKPDTAPHVENKFPVITSNEDSVKITIDISVLGWGYWGAFSTGRFIILAENGSSRLAFNPNSGSFEEFDNEATSSNSSEPPYVIKLKPSANKVGDIYPVTNKSVKYETVLETDNLSDYTISIRIYGTSGFTGPTAPLFINFANIRFSNTEEAPKGTIFKTVQGSNFTKEHEIGTVLWGDYLNSGLNGYFYNYPIDDTSSLHLPNGELSPPTWITAFDTTGRPLLHHISRQKSRLFSVAHDILKANINVESFDPLAIFQDCKGGKYVVVSAIFDFLRSEVDVELEQIAYDNDILKRDFIYSYFGEGEDNIKSIGGISGGSGGGTGGGLTPEQLEILSWWKKDPVNPNTIFTEMNAYSKLELSAYGAGDGGGGGGSDYERLDTWASYDSSKAEWVLSALLGNDLNTRVTAIDGRVTDLENSAGGGGSGSVTSVGISVPTGLSVSNSPITSSGVIAIGLQAGYSIPTTVKQGQWDTAFTNNHTHSNKTVLDGITSALVSNWNTSFTNNHTHSNKTQLDLITQSNIDVLAKLSIVNGNLQINGNAYATGELSAYGAGDGGGGGGGIIETVYGYGNLGQTFNNSILTDTFNAYTINQINTRLVSVESGSATTVNTTGTGNAITSISKAGSVITANKDLTFSLSGHTHTISDITGLQTALNSKLETSIFNTHNTDNVRHITGAERSNWNGVVSDFNNLEIGGRNYFSVNDFVADNIARGYNYISVIEYEGNIAYRSSYIVLNNNIPRYLQGKFEANTQYYLKFNILWESYTDSRAAYIFVIRYTDGTESYITASTSQTYGASLTTEGKTIDYITTSRLYNGNVVIYNIQLEKGNKPTDWSPAFEDVDASINLVQTNLTTHATNTSNPHSVTKSQVGLGNVDNTSDLLKPISTATQTALNLKANLASPTFSGTVTAPKILINKQGNVSSGISWYNSTYNAWQDYMANSGTTNNGVNANITAPIGILVTSWARRSFIENATGHGWTFESGTTMSTTPLVVAEIRASDGAARFAGNITVPKVIFNSAGWSMEQVGSELQMKHNNVLKMRFTSTGAIVATNEITAFG